MDPRAPIEAEIINRRSEVAIGPKIFAVVALIVALAKDTGDKEVRGIVEVEQAGGRRRNTRMKRKRREG